MGIKFYCLLGMAFILLVVLFAYGGGWWPFSIRKETEIVTPGSKIDLDVERERWSKRIDAVGARRAYEEFKKAYPKALYLQQHAAAHIMGELLYAKDGLRAFDICDGVFGFGCYHEFLDRAFTEEGLTIVPALARTCRDKYGEEEVGCQHGVGHGFLVHLGDERLIDALEMCDNNFSFLPLHGCTGGVFMEYNDLITFRHSAPPPRELNPNNPYEPCNTIVPEKFRPSCYFEAILWWKNVLGVDYERFGKLCHEVPVQLEREACFRGTGHFMTNSLDRPEVSFVLSNCSKMPHSDEGAVCLLGAAWAALRVVENEKLAQEICKNLEEVSQCP